MWLETLCDYPKKIETKFKLLENLIMKTRDELTAKIQELQSSTEAEKGQVKVAIASLTNLINVLQAKILQLQNDSLPQDFSVEYALLGEVLSDISGIYTEPVTEVSATEPTVEPEATVE